MARQTLWCETHGVTHSDADRAHSVAAGMLIRHNSVLLCHRSTQREWYPGVWDLPGGHVDQGERASATLVRELREELGIEVHEPTAACHYRIAGSDFDLKVWIVTEWRGTPVNASPDEHDAVAWFSAPQTLTLELADQSYSPMISEALHSSTS